MVRRAIFLIPLLVASVALLAFAACRELGIEPHVHGLALAAAITCTAAELAMIPLWLSRGATQAPVAQSGLVATVMHMLLAAGGGLGASAAIGDSRPFLNWLMLFYAATLLAVCFVAVRAVKSAPMEARANGQTT